jgi:predicted DNA-binding protein (UPF0251 family)
MIEISAKKVKGFLLYSPVDQRHFFRIYDPEDKTKFVDYKITAEEIEIQLLSDFNALIHDEKGKRLDFSSRVLGKQK